MTSLTERILKSSVLEYTSLIGKSKVYGKKDMIPTPVPMINVALSGRCDGGLTPGVTVLAGPSKHFKTMFALIMVASYLKKYPEARLILYDNEFGAPFAYFETLGINEEQVIHAPIMDAEELREEIMSHLKALERGDKVIMMIDSIGNLASRTEITAATDPKKSNEDMGRRAKAIKGIFRMVTPQVNMKDIPLLVVNHVYDKMDGSNGKVVSGGTGVYYSADTIWIIGRQQDAVKVDGKNEVVGFDFIINIEKSRYLQEKSKIPINVKFDGGMSKWSGLFDIARELDIIKQDGVGWYRIPDKETKARRSDVEDDDAFWMKLFTTTDFAKQIEKMYAMGTGKLLDDQTAFTLE